MKTDWTDRKHLQADNHNGKETGRPGEEILIIGLGLIGGSYAMGLSRKGFHISAVDIDGEGLAWARQKGIIAQGASPGEARTKEWIARAQRIVLGLYPKDMGPWVQAHKDLFRPGLVLADVAGVKAGIVEPIQAMLPDDVEFIGCHPMAGREVGGVRNSDDSIFHRANFILTPTDKNTPRGIAFARQLATSLSFAHVAELTLEGHDQMIAFLSQLTHAIAVSLMNSNDDPHLSEYTGDSFRDLTRIARINEKLWSELFLLNKEALLREIDGFQAQLHHLRQSLARDDREELMRLFVRSTQRRAQFDRQA